MSTQVEIGIVELRAKDLADFCTLLLAENMEPFVSIGDRTFLIQAVEAVDNDVVLFLHNPKTRNVFAVEVSMLTAEHLRRHYEGALNSQTFGRPPDLCSH